MVISYVIGTHNEEEQYISVLLEQLLKHKDEEDEIILVDDFSTNEETLNAIEKYRNKIQVWQHALNGDFASHKNYMNSLAKGDYIFNIDADETPNVNLILTLKEIIINNPGVDLFSVPRINIVEGLTQEFIDKWGWRINEHKYVNYPDYQNRIYKNKPTIKWVNKIHEVISGTETHTALPAFDEEGKIVPDYCLFHPKKFERQLQQNTFYESIN